MSAQLIEELGPVLDTMELPGMAVSASVAYCVRHAKMKEMKDEKEKMLKSLRDGVKKLIEDINDAVKRRRVNGLYTSSKLTDDDLDVLDLQERAYDILETDSMDSVLQDKLLWDFPALYLGALATRDSALSAAFLNITKERCTAEDWLRDDLLDGESDVEKGIEKLTAELDSLKGRYRF
jgi:hypothetical protein